MYKEIWDSLIRKYGEDFYWGWWNSEMFMEELNNELCEKHPLYNNIECFVGKSFADDDALYLTKNGRAVIVHLGWPNKKKMCLEFSYLYRISKFRKCNTAHRKRICKIEK